MVNLAIYIQCLNANSGYDVEQVILRPTRMDPWRQQRPVKDDRWRQQSIVVQLHDLCKQDLLHSHIDHRRDNKSTDHHLGSNQPTDLHRPSDNTSDLHRPTNHTTDLHHPSNNITDHHLSNRYTDLRQPSPGTSPDQLQDPRQDQLPRNQLRNQTMDLLSFLCTSCPMDSAAPMTDKTSIFKYGQLK